MAWAIKEPRSCHFLLVDLGVQRSLDPLPNKLCCMVFMLYHVWFSLFLVSTCNLIFHGFGQCTSLGRSTKKKLDYIILSKRSLNVSS